MKFVRLFFLLSILISLFFTGCSTDELGMFYSLSIEQKVADNETLDNTIFVKSVATTATGTSRHFLAAGRVYYRDNASTNWNEISMPSGMEYCTDLVVATDGTEYVYASFIKNDLTDYGVYITPTSSPGTWTEIYSSKRVTNLFHINDNGTQYLLCNAQDSNGHTLIYDAFGGGYSFQSDITNLTNVATPIISVVADPTGTDPIMAITPTNIYTDSTGIASLASLGTPPSGITIYRDIYYDGTTFYVVGLEDQYVSKSSIDSYATSSADGTTWTTKKYDDVIFNRIIFNTPTFYVGTDSGVYTGTAISSLAEIGSTGNYYSTNLKDSNVNELHIGGATSTLFAGTTGTGLWSREASGTTWRWE